MISFRSLRASTTALPTVPVAPMTTIFMFGSFLMQPLGGGRRWGHRRAERVMRHDTPGRVLSICRRDSKMDEGPHAQRESGGHVAGRGSGWAARPVPIPTFVKTRKTSLWEIAYAGGCWRERKTRR